MRKKEEELRKNYPPLILYTTQLRDISVILQEEEIKYSIDSKDYHFNDLDDFIANRKDAVIHDLSFTSVGIPYFSINFTADSSRIYFSQNNSKFRSLFMQIDSILWKQRRDLHWLFSFKLFWFWNLAPFVFVLVTLISGSTLTLTPLFFYWGAFVVWGVWSMFFNLRRHSIIRVYSEDSKGSFIRRKGDDLIIVIIASLLSALLGVGGTLLVQYFSSK